MPAALERLLGVDVRACVHPSAEKAPNVFRQCYLYSREINHVLKWHELSLRNLFEALCCTGRNSPSSLVE